MNPAMTGWDKKFTKNPSRKTPMAIKMTPEIKASVTAARAISVDDVRPRFPIAAAVMSETTATGPTAKARDVPKIAYATKGKMDAYRPISAGRPANNA